MPQIIISSKQITFCYKRERGFLVVASSSELNVRANSVSAFIGRVVFFSSTLLTAWRVAVVIVAAERNVVGGLGIFITGN